jgi:hypothetical protein
MHLRRAACFVLGAWIIGSLFVAYIAVQNATTAERLLSAPPPEFAKMIRSLGPDRVTTILQYQGAEQNRYYLDSWERMQLFLGPLLVVLLVFATRVSRIAIALCGTMIVFTAFAHFVLTPEINYIGRSLDFAAGWSGAHKRVWVLRATYTSLEALKLTLGCVLAGYLFVFKAKRVRPAGEISATEVGALSPSHGAETSREAPIE